MEVLDKLNQSSAATAATLTAVRQAQEASLTTPEEHARQHHGDDDALQEQIDWNFAEVCNLVGATEQQPRTIFPQLPGKNRPLSLGNHV